MYSPFTNPSRGRGDGDQHEGPDPFLAESSTSTRATTMMTDHGVTPIPSPETAPAPAPGRMEGDDRGEVANRRPKRLNSASDSELYSDTATEEATEEATDDASDAGGGAVDTVLGTPTRNVGNGGDDGSSSTHNVKFRKVIVIDDPYKRSPRMPPEPMAPVSPVSQEYVSFQPRETNATPPSPATRVRGRNEKIKGVIGKLVESLSACACGTGDGSGLGGGGKGGRGPGILLRRRGGDDPWSDVIGGGAFVMDDSSLVLPRRAGRDSPPSFETEASSIIVVDEEVGAADSSPEGGREGDLLSPEHFFRPASFDDGDGSVMREINPSRE